MKIIDLGIFGRPISMGSPIVFFGLPVAAFVSSLILSCGQRIPAHSTVTTVDIPQTPVRNQQKTGFCWAYATAGMVEAWSLKSGKALNVSEEAIAFYRVAEELLYVSKDSVLRQKIIDAPTMTDSLMDEVFVEGLQGGEVLYTDSLPSKQRTLSGLEILEKYGAWPETACPTKIGNSRPVIYSTAG